MVERKGDVSGEPSILETLEYGAGIRLPDLGGIRERVGKRVGGLLGRGKPSPGAETPPVVEILQQEEPLAGQEDRDEDLEEALGKGPSSLIAAQIKTSLARTTGETGAGTVPLKAWLLNPSAAATVLWAIANEATVQAKVRKVIGNTVTRLAEIAGADAQQDGLLNHAQQLEETLGGQLEAYCWQRNLPVPPQGTIERKALLLRMNSEVVALWAHSRAITEEGERLVREQVGIQAETAREKMLARELPQALEATKEANVPREELLRERARHALALVSATISGGLVGAVGGVLGGMESAISTLVEKYPEVAIPLGAGAGLFVFQLVRYSGPLTAEILKTFALQGGLFSVAAAVGVGIGVGLWASRGDSQTPEVNAQH